MAIYKENFVKNGDSFIFFFLVFQPDDEPLNNISAEKRSRFAFTENQIKHLKVVMGSGTKNVGFASGFGEVLAKVIKVKCFTNWAAYNIDKQPKKFKKLKKNFIQFLELSDKNKF